MSYREIGRLGEYTGHSFVIIGAVAAVLSSITKIVVYRRSFPQW